MRRFLTNGFHFNRILLEGKVLFKANKSLFLTYEEENMTIHAYSIHTDPCNQRMLLCTHDSISKMPVHMHTHICIHVHTQAYAHLYFIFLITQNWVYILLLSMLTIYMQKNLPSIGTQYFLMYAVGTKRPTFQSC